MLKYGLSLFAGLLIFVSGTAWSLSPHEILEAADQARGNLDGVTWEVHIRSIKNKKENTMTLNVKARGFDVATENIAPAKYKGNKLLMLNGNMWFYKPGLSKPVPISKRQKLLGNAVYGDIAATNYADDYTPDLMTEEIIDEELCYKFDLKSKNKKNTYDRIVYWVSKKRLVGVKSEFYTVSGKKFKSAKMKYENTVVIDGKGRPFISEVIIWDELLGDDTTTLRLNDPNIQALPDYLFNLNLM